MTTSSSTTTEPEVIPRGTVEAELTFYAPPTDGAVPYFYVGTPPPDTPVLNVGSENHTVPIHDLRGLEDTISLDTQAFTVLQNLPSVEKDFVDEEKIKSAYYAEIDEIIKKNVPGAEEVIIFDHTIRRSHPGANRSPVTRVHIDQTPKSGLLRVHQHLSPERAKEVIDTNKRARIINVWRPINGPVVSFPLAFADSSTVDEKDLVGIRHIYPDREGETAGVKHAETQKWWYLSGIKNDEVVLLKCFDTDTVVGGGKPGRRGRVPHSAFVDPRTPEGAKGRESIEVRCLVIG